MTPRRFENLDAARGFAMVWMTVFHFCFDLSNARIIEQNFYHDPFWTWQRTCILSLFLLCAGAGQAVAHAQGQSWRQFGRRWLQIAGAAALVSLGSWFMFPNSYIYFGVLHGMAVMLLIVRLMASLGAWCALAGGLVIAMHLIAVGAISTYASGLFGLDFDAPGLNWLGLITRLPVTEDYVPLFPWLGVMLLGFAGMRLLLNRNSTQPFMVQSTWVKKACARFGGYSLSYYLLHQPVMLGLLWLTGVSR